jgi:hypothetical protein
LTSKRGAILIALGLATALGVAAGGDRLRAEPARPRAVIELFTSQGCGKCPPADALLERLSAEPGIVTLSFAVDYWDYLGWKDTAARPEFTQRQRGYAEHRGDHAVYTPQMVINGRAHVVGSDRHAIDRTIATLADEGRGPMIPVDVETTGDALVVTVADAPEAFAHGRATVWIAHFDRARTVPIRKGENSGKTVTYAHLVKSLQPIGMWKGKAMRIELPRQEATHDKGEGCVVLVQVDGDNGPGPIVGARELEAPAS